MTGTAALKTSTALISLPRGAGVTVSGFYGIFTGFMTNTAAPATNLTEAYQAVLTGGNYSSGATACTVTLNNLTLGEQYQVQLWVDDSRSAGSSRTETVSSGTAVTLDYNNTDVPGGLGQYTLGTFTADAATQTITLTGNASSQINAIQLRDLGLPPTALTPVFSPPAGKYLLAQTVTISSSPGSTVYYTIDGSTPTNTSLHGTEGSGSALVSIPAPTNNMTIKAYATSSAQADSAIGSATYTTYATPAVPTWINRAGGVWAVVGNWSNSVMASGSSITADFSQLSLPANETVYLGGSRTIGNMIFGDTGNTYSWTLTTNATGGVLTLDSTNPPTITVNNQTAGIGAVMTGTKGLTKAGSGTLTLSNANSYTGTTLVKAGTLEVTARSGDAPYVITNGTTLKIGYTTGGGYAGTQLKLYGDGTAATTGLYLKGGFSYNGSGQIQLLNAPTTIRQYGTGLAGIGMFDINGNALWCSSAASGSVIDANIQMISRGYGMSATIDAGANTATGDLVINGPLNAGSLGFYKRGGGSVRLNGAALTNNLALKVQGGTAICGVSDCIGTNASLNVSAGATLDLNGFSQTVTNATLAGNLKVTITKGGTSNSDVLTVTDSINALAYGGSLTVVNAGGALTLGDTFKLFNSPVGYSGAFTSIILPALPDALGWTNTLAYDGSITVVPAWEPPTIVSPPAPALSGVFAGSPFSLWGVNVQGATPLSYQWQHAGTNIPGATASFFTKASATAEDAGDYQLVVANRFGTNTSATATLAIAASSVSESFDYAAGPLAGQGPAAGLVDVWTAGASGDNTVIIPGAGYSGPTTRLTSSGNALLLEGSDAGNANADKESDALLPVVSGLGSNGTVYVSFIGQLTNNMGWGGVELTLYGVSKVLLGANWQNQPWGWGDRGNFNSQSGHSSIPCSTQAFLVYRFDFTPTNSLVRLYINPDLGSEPATATISGTWTSFAFRCPPRHRAHRPRFRVH